MKMLKQHNRAFTLIEALLAMALLGVVVMAIYSSWSAIVKGAKVGLEAAATAQRKRMAIRTIQDALTSAQMFAENGNLYAFVAENGSEASLSFVARLSKSFPRGGKFGDFAVRRVTFSLEPGAAFEKRLVLRQNPLLLEVDRDEQENPLVLAHNVKEFRVEFWEPRIGDWIDEWTTTNQLPKMAKVFLRLSDQNQSGFQTSQEDVTRIIGLPSAGVPSAWQVQKR